MLLAWRHSVASIAWFRAAAAAGALHTSANTQKSLAQVEQIIREKRLGNALKKATKKLVPIWNGMSIRELADIMGKTTAHVNECLDQLKYAQQSQPRTDNWTINNLDVIAKIVKLSGMRFQLGAQEKVDFDEIETELMEKNETRATRAKPKPQDLVRRHPVVTIMGHVDHGKTTLLDSLRGSNVVASEFGGITQHIGAFNCSLSDSSAGEKRSITFLDTPGHAIFSEMRFRGAKVTDIVVLVVAAEDGVMAQTVESLQFAKASKCPIIVAINKIDKVNPSRVDQIKRDLLKYELISEDLGGDVQMVPISALKKINLDRLKEEIWTRAEIMELKGDPKGLVEGYVIESSQDAHRGKLATVLVQRGTLQKSQFLVAGTTWCKVKSIMDERAQTVGKASLSQAVQVMGWKELPSAGDEVLQVSGEHRAKELAELRTRLANLKREKQDMEAIRLKRKEHLEFYQTKLHEKRMGLTRVNRVAFDELYGDEIVSKKTPGIEPKDHKLDHETATLNVIIKADVDGSLEAILSVLESYPTENPVRINIVHFEVGPLKKSDLELAETFHAIVYCFNIPPNPSLSQTSLSTEDKTSATATTVRHFNIIYKLFDNLKEELNSRAPLVEKEEKVGEAEILKVFDYEETRHKTIRVAGGRCLDGIMEKKAFFRVVRNGSVVYTRQACKSLKHLKADVNSVKRNVEFGLVFEDEQVSVQPGDRIECISIKMVKDPIEWDLGF